MMPDFECTWWLDTWFGVSITPCCERHDLVEQTLSAHWDLAVCVVGQLGWAGIPVAGLMLIGLVGPPGMIYRKIQKLKHRQ